MVGGGNGGFPRNLTNKGMNKKVEQYLEYCNAANAVILKFVM